MRDPKFGYHWIWLLPLYSVLFCAVEAVGYVKELNHRRKIRKILKDPEIAELSKLAGIRE